MNLPNFVSYCDVSHVFKHKSYFKYIENMPAKFQSNMSSHSLAIARQKYNGMLSYTEISLNFHTLSKALSLAKK